MRIAFLRGGELAGRTPIIPRATPRLAFLKDGIIHRYKRVPVPGNQGSGVTYYEHVSSLPQNEDAA